MDRPDEQSHEVDGEQSEEVALLEQPSSPVSASETVHQRAQDHFGDDDTPFSLDFDKVSDGQRRADHQVHNDTNKEQPRTYDVQPLRSDNNQRFAVESPVDGKAVIKRVDRHLLPSYFLLALLCSIDRANLSYAALQLNDDLHFSHSVYGLGSGLFFIGYMVFQIPSTYMCARIGAPVFLGCILIAWGLVATLFTWMKTSTQFYILRLILGLAESGAYPGMWYSMALFYNDKELGLAYTRVALATAVAGVVGGPIAACLLLLDGAGGLRGWQWLFLLEGLPAIALGTAMCFLLARCPATASFLSLQEKDWLLCRKAKLVPRQSSDGLQGACSKDATEEYFYRSWRMWYLGGAWLLNAAGFDGVVFWGPIFIDNILEANSVSGAAAAADATAEVTETGSAVWPVVKAALLSAIPFGAASVCMVLNAYLAKRAGERHWHIALSAFAGALALCMMTAFLGRVEWAAFACFSLAAAGIWSTHGPLLSWPAAILSGGNAAAGFALVKMVGCVGSFLGPYMIGILTDASGGSFTPALLVLSACMFLAGVMLLLFWDQPGGRRTFLPECPYGRGLLFKRSRSDVGVVDVGPVLRSTAGDRLASKTGLQRACLLV